MYQMFYRALAFECDLSKWCPERCADETSWEATLSGEPAKFMCCNMFCDAEAFSGRLHPYMLEWLRLWDLRRNARWLWRLAREGTRPEVLARLAAYHLMELGARPDAEGNAPRGAIEAFREDF
jgi:hypothetical protein